MTSYHLTWKRKGKGRRDSGFRGVHGKITSHVLFTFVDNESISSVWFLGFGIVLISDDSNPLNWTKPSEFTFKVRFLHIIAETGDE